MRFVAFRKRLKLLSIRGEVVMDKILSTTSYGICLFSLEVLQDFLKKEKVRSKKLLDNFKENHDRYLATLREGVWIPFFPINSIKYLINLDGYDLPFNNEWKQKMELMVLILKLKIPYGLWALVILIVSVKLLA
jgi:hypothetical protein